jgi:cytochrome P450
MNATIMDTMTEMLPFNKQLVNDFLVENSQWMWAFIWTATTVLFFQCTLLVGDRMYKQPPDEPLMIRSMTALQFVRRFITNDGPDFLLQLCRILQVDALRVPIPGVFRVKAFIVADPDAARSILENPKSIKTPFVYDFYDKIASGTTFFAHNGKRSTHVQKSTIQAFTNRRRMERITERILERWIKERCEPLYVKTGKPINMDEEMVLVTTDIFSQIAFDYELTFQERKLLVSSMQRSMRDFFSNTNIFKAMQWTSWMFPSSREMQLGTQQMVVICTKILKKHRQKPNPDPATLIDMMVNDQNYVSDEERISDMIMFLFCGFDGAAHTIAFALLELSRKPEEQLYLRQCLQNLETTTNTTTNTTNTETKNSNDARYYCPPMKHVIRETLRLYCPNALGSIRTPSEDVLLKGKKRIPAGSICVMPFYVILRNESIYKYADSFVPSRWEHPTSEQIKAFFPFATGRRSCQGQVLATVELGAILSRLISMYEFHVVALGRPDYSVTLKPVGTKLGIKAIVKSKSAH